MEEKINLCVLDFEQDDIEKLENKGFKVYKGSAGTKVSVSYPQGNYTRYCILDYKYPSNMHEYNILVINMIHNKTVPYILENHQRKEVASKSEVKFEVSTPSNIFDPRPYSFAVLYEELREFVQKENIIIVFADKFYETEYKLVKFGNNYYSNETTKDKFSNYSFLPNMPLKRQKHGFKSKIVAKKGIKKLLEDFNELEYHQTFIMPQINEEGQTTVNPNFLTLIENDSNEVISFVYSNQNSTVFVFPDIKNKGDFTSRFLTEIAPNILPDLFILNKQNIWLSDNKYYLPGHQILVQEKELMMERQKKELEKIDETIESNKSKFKFLHDLITETDEKLVDAVLFMLKFIGFNNAKKVDETKDDGLFEEDIQIEIEGKLLVIEVKGIGGTSKDSECSQISKIRLRRMKERQSTDVYGLYIVNHERFKPPHSRLNPPFNDNQIQDAINDDRGLLTTWDLYKLYINIESEIFSKEEVRECFFHYGLVNFSKSFVKVAKVDKIFKDGKVASFELDGIEISNGDIIISEKNNLLKKHIIISIEQDKIKYDNVSNGRTGISIDVPIENNSMLFKKQNN